MNGSEEESKPAKTSGEHLEAIMLFAKNLQETEYVLNLAHFQISMLSTLHDSHLPVYAHQHIEMAGTPEDKLTGENLREYYPLTECFYNLERSLLFVLLVEDLGPVFSLYFGN